MSHEDRVPCWVPTPERRAIADAAEARLRAALVEAARRKAIHDDLLEAFDYCVVNTDATHIGHLHFHCSDVDDLDTWAVASTWPDPLWRTP